MSTANEPTLWRRVRFTPLTDGLRGRLSGRLDVARLIAEAGLPDAAARRVREVVRRTRLWRSEKADVAAELIAHFQDGLEAGVEAAALVEGFGDPKPAARLIRRAKKRNRPWPWHVARATSLAVYVLVGVYVLSGLLLLLGRPAVTVDYVARLNAQALAVPEEDRAWPLYRELLLTGFLRDRDALEPIMVQPEGQSTPWPTRAGEPGWPEAVTFLHERREAIDLIRSAAAKPGLGLRVGHARDYTGVDREALYGPDHPEPGDVDDRYIERLVEGSLRHVLLPHLGYLRRMTYLLAADTELAWTEGDHDRVLANLSAMLGLARHIRDMPLLINSHTAISIVWRAQVQAADLLHRDSERWSRAELAQLAHLLAGVDPLVQPAYEGERMAVHDTLQRIYSERGYVTRDGLRYLARLTWMQPELNAMGEGQRQVDLVTLIGLPLANMVMASRSEMEREYEELMAMLEAQGDQPPWERSYESSFDAAVAELADDPIQRLRYAPLVALMPALDGAQRTAERSLALRDAVQVAIAMELHRRDHGRYPDAPADLSPRYLPTPPVDYFTGDPLRVRYTDHGGFVLYSLGPNGEDDGGMLSDDGRDRWPGTSRTGDWVLYPPVIHPAAAPDQGER